MTFSAVCRRTFSASCRKTYLALCEQFIFAGDGARLDWLSKPRLYLDIISGAGPDNPLEPFPSSSPSLIALGFNRGDWLRRRNHHSRVSLVDIGSKCFHRNPKSGRNLNPTNLTKHRTSTTVASHHRELTVSGDRKERHGSLFPSGRISKSATTIGTPTASFLDAITANASATLIRLAFRHRALSPLNLRRLQDSSDSTTSLSPAQPSVDPASPLETAAATVPAPAKALGRTRKIYLGFGPCLTFLDLGPWSITTTNVLGKSLFYLLGFEPQSTMLQYPLGLSPPAPPPRRISSLKSFFDIIILVGKNSPDKRETFSTFNSLPSENVLP